MKKTSFIIATIACLLTNVAIAAKLPSYYPANGFRDTGRVDALYVEEGRIVIDDVSYQISTSAVVHSLSSYSDSMARVRVGAHVAFKLKSGDLIVEFWMLPRNYDASKRR
ncbi:MAG: hypothetical protein KJO95_06140 [Gammaproteobacteria bacterium]|nr:hypothetical protein [Gammaproteobacteria bacterium]